MEFFKSFQNVRNSNLSKTKISTSKTQKGEKENIVQYTTQKKSFKISKKPKPNIAKTCSKKQKLITGHATLLKRKANDDLVEIEKENEQGSSCKNW